jgi:hypothetical protein
MLLLTIGFVGRLVLTIPWGSIGTKPITIELADIYVIVGPNDEALKVRFPR